MIKRVRLQLTIALLGIGLLGVLLASLAFSRTIAVVPDKGGRYVEGVVGNPTLINAILWRNETDRDLAHLIFSGLTKTDERGQAHPDLAERWEISEDGQTYTFFLRRDVRWHDGTLFTADDVLFTVGLLSHPAYQAHPEWASLWRSLKVEKESDFIVSFELSESFSPFLAYTSVGILPEHLLGEMSIEEVRDSEFNRIPIGTGMFQIEESRDDHVILRANRDFYGSQPRFQEIEFRFYTDYHALLSAYDRAEIQGVSQVLPEDLDRAVAYEDLNLYSAPLSSYTLVFLSLRNPIFSEKAVRQALLMATNRKALIERVLDGQGILAHSPVPPFSWAYNAGVKKYRYDPEAARAVLDEAGWLDSDGDGNREKEGHELHFTLVTNDDPIRVQLVRAIQRTWGEIGIQVSTKAVSTAELAEEHLRPRQFDAVLFGWNSSAAHPDLYSLWHSSQVVDEGQNYAGFQSEEADELLEFTRRMYGQDAQKKLYDEFQKLFAEELPALLLYHPVYNYAVDEEVKNVQIGPMNTPSDRFRGIDRWYVRTRRVIVPREPEQAP